MKCARTFEVFGESTMSSSIAGLGKTEKMSTTDKTIKAVKKLILDNRRIGIWGNAGEVDISIKSCPAIFTDVWGKIY